MQQTRAFLCTFVFHSFIHSFNHSYLLLYLLLQNIEFVVAPRKSLALALLT